jgi:Glucose / Sorbosone dehydrogenase
MLKLAFKPIQVAAGSLDSAGPGKSATGLTELRFVPGAPSEIFVSQKGARITHLRLEGDSATLVRRYTVPGVFAEEDCGLISFAFDPDYADNKYLYAAFCTSANRSKVVRFTVGETLSVPVDIIEFSEPSSSAAFHSIGSIGFDRDKNMWMLHGEFYNQANAQNLNSTMGKLLRFVPSRAPGMGGLQPAPGNPFVGMAGRSPLVYASGFRSPWRGYLDSRGRFLVGDVGPGTAEEVNLVTAPGQNFGWNGSRVGPCASCPGLTSPISTYRVANDPYEGDGNPVWENRPRRSVWVGVQYEDCGNDRYGGAMTGVYVFGDLFSGWVRGAVIDDAGKKTADRPLADMAALSAWAQGPDGYLYALRFGNYGDHLTGHQLGIFRVERAP